MIDLDTLVKLGWTALLGWNLRETVQNGKELAGLKAKVENGLTSGLEEMKLSLEKHMDGEEERLLKSIERGGVWRDPRARTRRTDRLG